jgi:predicted 2-oxoglutarate/Fe(II)-dependent dioxygenase YbiX
MLPGSYLIAHKDEDPNPDGAYDGKKRSFVCSILLNDSYEGGELWFPEHGSGGKPRPGSLVLFPGFYTEHEVKEIVSGQRVNILIFFYDMLP